MSATSPTSAAGRLASWRSRFRWLRYPWFSILVVIAFVGVGILAPVLTDRDPNRPVLSQRLKPPGAEYVLGTDSLGRDVLTRIFHGARTTLTVAALTIAIGGGFGLVLGLLGGYLGGGVDAVVSRLIDVSLAFPVIFFGLVFAVSVGPGMLTVVVAISLVMWARIARVVRAETLAVKDREYVSSALVSGASTTRILVRHVLPNVTSTFTVLVSINLGTIILAEAALSFLGAGVPLPNASWGAMITEGQAYLTRAWWIAVFPGVAISLSVLAANLFGDWLRDFLDPELRQLL